MRKSFLPVLFVGTLALGACAYGPGGGVLGDILGGGGGGYGYDNQDFERAAVRACGDYAARYGRVTIRNVQRVSSSSLRVYGTVDNGQRRDDFACTFRSDGRITDFDI